MSDSKSIHTDLFVQRNVTKDTQTKKGQGVAANEVAEPIVDKPTSTVVSCMDLQILDSAR